MSLSEKSITALLCGAVLVPLLIGGWLVQRRFRPVVPVDTTYGTVTVVMHQPGYYQRLDSVARDSARRDSLRHRKSSQR